MAFLCPVRVKKGKRSKGYRGSNAPLPGRLTGSASIDTLVRVEAAKEHGPRATMLVKHDFVPCVDDEMQVKRGQRVHVLYQENDWLYVLGENGREGFIPDSYCLPLERSVDDFALPHKIKQAPHQNHGELTNENGRSVPTFGNGRKNQHPPSTEQRRSIGFHSSKSMPDISGYCDSKFNPDTNDTQRTPNPGILKTSFVKTRREISSDEKANISSTQYSNYNDGRRPRSKNKVQQFTNTNASTPARGGDHKQKQDPRPTPKSPSNLKTTPKAASVHGTPSAYRKAHDLKHDAVNSAQRLGNSLGTISHGFHVGDARSNVGANTNDKANRTIRTNQQNVPLSNFNSSAVSAFHKRSRGRYITLFDFSAIDEGDVSVQRGEFVTVLNVDDPSWFWVSCSNQQEGFVPSSYLRPAKQDSEMAVANAELEFARAEVGIEANVWSTCFTKLLCLYDYCAQAQDDLSVTRGDWLYANLHDQKDNSWLWVYSSTQNKCGFIPRTYAKPPNFGLQADGMDMNMTISLDPFVSP